MLLFIALLKLTLTWTRLLLAFVAPLAGTVETTVGLVCGNAGRRAAPHIASRTTNLISRLEWLRL